ncbi:MAG: hypothetical protein AAFX55_06200, partial [Bacteroidota bacterium]
FLLPEEEILAQLKKKRLINSESFIMKNNFIKIAASILILVSVFYAGKLSTKNSQENQQENLYAIFLYENDEFKVENPNELITEYTNWAIDLNKKGLLAYAEKLDVDNRNWFGSSTVKNVQSKLTGYFVYSANNYDAAKQIAESHPHTNYGGGIELIQIDKIKAEK